MEIKVIKFENYIQPIRKHHNDAGLDVHVTKTVGIWPGRTEKIPLGFGVEIPDGFMGLILPRSGLSSEGVFTQASPIDSGYRGEVHAITTNTGPDKRVFKKGDRVGQLVIIPIVIPRLVEEFTTHRGDAGFASTGK